MQPVDKLHEWINHAKENVSGNWNAMCLSTLGNDQFPDSRIVLLKDIQEDKLFFYTNYESKKGEDIFTHQKVAINFYWDSLDRQLRLQGEVKKVPRENSIAYFKSRPLESQVSGIVSHQSRDIKSYDELKKRYDDLLESATDENLECPEHWGGFEFTPHRIEFWQAHPYRLHRREVFQKNKNGEWDTSLISP